MIKLIKLLESLKQKLLAHAKSNQVKKLESAAIELDTAFDKANETLDALYRFCEKVERMAIDAMNRRQKVANDKKAAASAKLDELNKL